MVARVTLNHLVKVRILSGQFNKSLSRKDLRRDSEAGYPAFFVWCYPGATLKVAKILVGLSRL